MPKLKIAFTMIHYPVAMGRYFLEALLRRDDVEVWSAGPYTGRHIPWNGGMYLPESYLLEPDYATDEMLPVSYSFLEKQCPWEPDLWIEVNAGLKISGKPKAPLAVIGTDPHVLDYSMARTRADKFFNMQTPYMQDGDVWLPYAYDPVFHPQTTIPAANREYHATLLGLQYPNRVQLFDTLNSRSMKTKSEIGLAYHDARDIYHNTRVGVNWSSLQDTTARVFELMAFGICPVLNFVPDLQQLFTNGEHYIGFDTMAEALLAIDHFAHAPAEVDKIGRQAREAVEPHTYDARITTVLETMGLLDDPPSPIK